MDTVSTLSTLLVMATLLCSVQCQWAQTLGWGGAGVGKREFRPAFTGLGLSRQQLSQRHVTREPSSTAPAYLTACSVDLTILSVVQKLIQEEEARVQQCLEVGSESKRK